MLRMVMLAGLSTLALATGTALAQDVVRGRDLMTPQERMEMQYRMRSAETAEVRAAIRTENQARMHQRADQRGYKLLHDMKRISGWGAGPAMRNHCGSRSGLGPTGCGR